MSFKLWAPKLWKAMKDALDELYAREPWLVRTFERSVYPTSCFNLGPQSVCTEHLDMENAPASWCSIHALGEYDPDHGGHLILFDFGLAIRFPPGSTILIPSASLRHGNTKVREHENRLGFTSFCPGGLLRWVACGFQLLRHMSLDDQLELERKDRRQEVLSLFSKLSELEHDRAEVFGGARV